MASAGYGRSAVSNHTGSSEWLAGPIAFPCTNFVRKVSPQKQVNFPIRQIWTFDKTRRISNILISQKGYGRYNVCIESGDVVCQKRGGFLMTVEAVHGDYATCVWFHNQKIHADRFLVADLSKWMLLSDC